MTTARSNAQPPEIGVSVQVDHDAKITTTIKILAELANAQAVTPNLVSPSPLPETEAKDETMSEEYAGEIENEAMYSLPPWAECERFAEELLDYQRVPLDAPFEFLSIRKVSVGMDSIEISPSKKNYMWKVLLTKTIDHTLYKEELDLLNGFVDRCDLSLMLRPLNYHDERKASNENTPIFTKQDGQFITYGYRNCIWGKRTTSLPANEQRNLENLLKINQSHIVSSVLHIKREDMNDLLFETLKRGGHTTPAEGLKFLVSEKLKQLFKIMTDNLKINPEESSDAYYTKLYSKKSYPTKLDRANFLWEKCWQSHQVSLEYLYPLEAKEYQPTIKRLDKKEILETSKPPIPR